MRTANNTLFEYASWLGSQSLATLQSQFPDQWFKVKSALETAVKDVNHAQVDALIRPVLPRLAKGRRLTAQDLNNLREKLVEQRLAALYVQTFLHHALAPATLKRSIPFLDRLIYRAVFFNKTGRRKVVSTTLFDLLWPRVSKRNLLLPLAEARGAYGFFSQELATGLAELIGNRRCLEIAAGDGVLASALAKRRVNITACDDFSWQSKIRYGANVQKMDVASALQTFEPEVVICSWPPPLNTFERHVFSNKTVQTYIVIGGYSANHFGNQLDYAKQTSFLKTQSERLATHLVPGELRGTVYIFERILEKLKSWAVVWVLQVDWLQADLLS